VTTDASQMTLDGFLLCFQTGLVTGIVIAAAMLII
jgi:hypothetical protein